MAAGGTHAGPAGRLETAPLVAVLGLLAVGACVLVAVITLTERRIDLYEQRAQTVAEREAGRVAVAVRDIESSVEHLDPSSCDPQVGSEGAGPEFAAVAPTVAAPSGATLWCVPAGADTVDGMPVDLTDQGIRVALALSRDLGTPVLSAPSPGTEPVVAGPVYEVGGELTVLPSGPHLDARRADLVGHVVAVVDVASLLDQDLDWEVSDAAVVLARTGDLGGERRAEADVAALDRRWTVTTDVTGLGWWRPRVFAVSTLGILGAVLLGLADRQRRRTATSDLDSRRQAERRASAIRTLTGIVQTSHDLDQILPALAVQLSDELDLDGLSLSVVGVDGQERAIFTHGARPDPTARSGDRRAVSPGSTVALDLHRAERSVAVLRGVAGRELAGEELELLEVAGEIITSTIVSGRSMEQQQEAVARLEALDELKTTFLGVASHELRTPATAISGLASLLASRWDDLAEDDRRAFATRIATNADALNALVQDLLDFARLERGDLRLTLSPVELDTTVERVLSRLDGVWGSHGVSRSVEPGVEVLGEVNAIERIVTNLVANAVKFSPAGADVEVIVESRDGRARLLVDDSGPGVPVEERQKIFVRFFRGTGDEVVRTRGVGIGLSVVEDFVAQMGGTVHVEDSPAGGARFVVELDALDRSEIGDRHAATT